MPEWTGANREANGPSTNNCTGGTHGRPADGRTSLSTRPGNWPRPQDIYRPSHRGPGGITRPMAHRAANFFHLASRTAAPIQEARPVKEPIPVGSSQWGTWVPGTHSSTPETRARRSAASGPMRARSRMVARLCSAKPARRSRHSLPRFIDSILGWPAQRNPRWSPVFTVAFSEVVARHRRSTAPIAACLFGICLGACGLAV